MPDLPEVFKLKHIAPVEVAVLLDRNWKPLAPRLPIVVVAAVALATNARSPDEAVELAEVIVVPPVFQPCIFVG
jgi:hypothetical protein